MKRFFFLLSTCILFSGSALAQSGPNYSARVLLIPLDDRPPCHQFTERMGLIGDAEVVSPPRELLGRFTIPGQSDKIVDWLRQQDLASFDAAIIVVDMIAYGGVVGARVHNIGSAEALKRVEVLADLRERAPKLPIYVQNVIMRLAPTADGKNEGYRAQLADWAEVSVGTDAKSKTETARLEQVIPDHVLTDYKRTRGRNLKINLRSIELVRNGVIDYLILSQDDAKPQGIHVADREKLIAETRRLGLTEKIAIQPGADEVAMLLLARSLNKHFNNSPRIKVVYSSEQLSNTVMPFEDRPLRQTVSYHLKATGSQQVENEGEADLLFYVYASRFEQGRGESFAKEIEAKIEEGKQVIVGDVDPRGDVQGGDTGFTVALLKRGLFPELSGYASWNTAGNTIGTALPQGIIFALARAKHIKSKAVTDRVTTAQNWFTLHRVLDDYYYHNVVRAQTNIHFNQHQWSSRVLTDEERQKVEGYSIALMQQCFEELVQQYFSKRVGSWQKNLTCEKPKNMTFALPWSRTFEAEIDFDITCHAGDK